MYHVIARVGAALLLGILAAPALGCATASPNEKAMAFARQHRESEGIALLRTELASHPGDLPARRLLVRLLAFTGQVDAARAEVAELEKRLPPDDPTPSIELGHALELARRFDEALAA
jgi:hypothetical protein